MFSEEYGKLYIIYPMELMLSFTLTVINLDNFNGSQVWTHV